MIEFYREQTFMTPEVALSYVEGPTTGKPVVFLHGAGSRWQPFQTVMDDLSNKYHVFALDMRGHGKSGHTPDAYNLENYATDLYQFIDSQIGSPAVIYGHSLGALVGIQIAARHSQSVDKLVLGDPPLYMIDTATQDTHWYRAFAELLDFKLRHPDLNEMDAYLKTNFPNMTPRRREERVQSLFSLDADAIRSIMSDDMMRGINLSSLISEISCPVMLLRGNPSLHSALREQDVTFVTKHVRNFWILDMETIGHGIIPPEYFPQLMEFIDADPGYNPF